MVGKYELARYFRDNQTRLFIPNIQITATDALTNIASSFVTNPYQDRNSFFPTKEERINFFENRDIVSQITNIIDTLSIGLGVTKIETNQEYVMPLSKGIGSTGEIIHLLGAKNETAKLEFKTDNYPGKLGYILRSLLQKILENAHVVYVIDDLFLAKPCLVKKFKVYKEGNYRGAVMGEVELMSLTTGGNWIKDRLGGISNIAKRSEFLKNSLKNQGLLRVVGLTPRVAVGVVGLSATFLAAIANGG